MTAWPSTQGDENYMVAPTIRPCESSGIHCRLVPRRIKKRIRRGCLNYFCNYSGPFWLWTIMGKGLPSFDKEGMCRDPIPDPGRGGWNPRGTANRQLFSTTPSSTSSRPPLLIRGEFKFPGS
jgi:hypothetical protein